MLEGSVQMMRVLHDAVRQGFMATITDDVKNVTGNDPDPV